MDSSESISFSQDTTTDSIDVVGHFVPKETQTQPSNLSPRKLQLQQRQRNQQQQQQQLEPDQHHSDKSRFQRRLTIFDSDTHRYNHEQKHETILLNSTTAKNMFYHDEETISDGIPIEREIIIVDQTPPPSRSTITATSSQNNGNDTPQHHLDYHFCQPASSSASTSSLTTFMTCCSPPNLQDGDGSDAAAAPTGASTSIVRSKHTTNGLSPGKKSVLFDRVTVYHFNRSQGFTSVPTEGGSTLGMNRKHFLRRRLSVDMFEEVRRRSRRQILLKIKLEDRKRERRLLQQQQQQGPKDGGSALSQPTSSSQTDDRAGGARASDIRSSSRSTAATTNGDASDTNGDKKIKRIAANVMNHGDQNDDEDDDDDEDSYSDLSDISDSELESDSYVFLEPIGVKLRRSLLRASGVCRIDPLEKKDCNKIRDSREKSGCKCIGQCLPEYCECSRLGVKCHVDRASFPCGCVSEGCKNPEGRTEFDKTRVRKHFEEKLLESYQCSDSQSNDEELLTTTPTSSTTSEESC